MDFPDYSIENDISKRENYVIVGVDECGRGCEHPSAEVLTKEGWKSYTDLSLEDLVLSYTKNGNIVWQNIDFVVEEDFNGNMVSLQNRSVDILVTEDHSFDVLRRTFKRDTSKVLRMVGYTYDRRASVRELKPNDFIPRGGMWVGEDKDFFVLPSIEKHCNDSIDRSDKHIPMDLWLKFLGIYLSEGHVSSPQKGVYSVGITQTKKDSKAKIYSTIKDLPFNVKLTKKGVLIQNKQLYMYLKQFGKCYDKFIPNDIKSLPPKRLEILLEWLLLGDGSSYTGNNRKPVFTYYTTSKRLRDDVEEVILKTCRTYKTTVRHSRDSYILGRRLRKENMVPCFEIRIRQNNKISAKFLHKTYVKYEGKVFCLGLKEHHNFYVRRSGSGYFSGNCGAGPVTAAAVFVPKDVIHLLLGKVNDSKKMSQRKREELFDVITEKCVYAVSDISSEVIDKINILEATKIAMMNSISVIGNKVDIQHVLVDGTVDLSEYTDIPTTKVIRGDSKSISIAAASIVAKVHRDRLMVELDKEIPLYNIKKNKGYLTADHIKALQLYGPTEHHRLSFNKVGK